MGLLGPFWRVAAAATFVGSLLGGLADLRFAGQGLGALLVAGLIGYAGMVVACAFRADRADVQMWAMMAGMAGGGFGGLVGALLAVTLAAALGRGHPHAMGWSMLLMGGSMGGMLGATLGGAAALGHRSRLRHMPRFVVWRLRRGA